MRRHPWQRRLILWSGAASLIPVVISPCWGAQWVITPAVDASGIYSDNIGRQPPGNETDDVVTRLAPRLSARTRTARLEAEVDYRLEMVNYQENSDNNAVFHQLQADTTTEIAPESLFFDARGTIGQASSEAGAVDSNLQFTGQRGDVGTLVLSPYWRQVYAGKVESELRYTAGLVEYEDPDTSDSTSQELDFYARTADRSARLQYVLSYTAQEVDYEIADDFTTRLVEGRVIYAASPRLSVFASAGYENNDFVTLPGEPDPEGSLWSVGFGWSPFAGATVESSYGERYFGSTFNLRVARETSRTAVSIEYDEELTTEAQRRRDEGVVTRIDPIGEDLEEVEFDEGGINPFTITNEPFIERSLALNIARLNARTLTAASAFVTRRDFQSSSDEEAAIGIDARWRWEFASTYTSLVTLSWQRIEQALARSEDEGDRIWQATAGISKEIRPNVRVRLDYQHFERNSDNAPNEYRENRIEAGIVATF